MAVTSTFESTDHVTPVLITLSNAHPKNFVASTKEHPLLRRLLNCVRFIVMTACEREIKVEYV